MNVVAVHGGMDVAALCHRANQLQAQYQFVPAPAPGSIPLLLSSAMSNVPFEVDLFQGVTVYTWQSKGISAYAGLTEEEYIFCWALLGLIQWRTLLLNPLLRADDLLHGEPSRCLYSQQLFMEDYALVLEAPHVCNSCLRFYGALCPHAEIGVLNAFLAFLRERNACAGTITA